MWVIHGLGVYLYISGSAVIWKLGSCTSQQAILKGNSILESSNEQLGDFGLVQSVPGK